MYYHLFCLQNNEVMETGRNSTSVEELKKGLMAYLSVDMDEEQQKDWEKLPVEEIASQHDFSIEQTPNKI